MQIDLTQNPSGLYTLGMGTDDPLWVSFEFKQGNDPNFDTEIKTGSWWIYAVQIQVPADPTRGCEGAEDDDGTLVYWVIDSQGFWDSDTEYRTDLRDVLIGGKNRDTINRVIRDGGSGLFQPDLGANYENRYCLKVYAAISNDWGLGTAPAFYVQIMDGDNKSPSNFNLGELPNTSLFYSSLIFIPIIALVRRRNHEIETDI